MLGAATTAVYEYVAGRVATSATGTAAQPPSAVAAAAADDTAEAGCDCALCALHLSAEPPPPRADCSAQPQEEAAAEARSVEGPGTALSNTCAVAARGRSEWRWADSSVASPEHRASTLALAAEPPVPVTQLRGEAVEQVSKARRPIVSVPLGSGRAEQPLQLYALLRSRRQSCQLFIIGSRALGCRYVHQYVQLYSCTESTFH